MADEEQPQTTEKPRCEIADLYFWLGKEAECVGFTPWITEWLVALPNMRERRS